MIEPKGHRYANTTERTMAAEKRIVRVVRGLLEQIDKIDDLLAPEHSLMEDRRVSAAKNLLKDMRRPYVRRS